MSTNIEWTASDDGTPGKTWNPTRGCSRISPGCFNCYAERMAARFSGPRMVKDSSGVLADGKGFEDSHSEPGPFAGFIKITNGRPGWTGKVSLMEDKLLDPLHWRKPCRCFVNSMSDLFHEALSPIEVDRVFAVMALCPHITFQVLTKRADVMQGYVNDDALVRINRQIELWMEFMEDFPKGRSFPRYCEEWPLKNVHLGVSVEDKLRKYRIDRLRDTSAAIRFVSFEPLLEDLGDLDLSGISWAIWGGESGPGARPLNIDWIRHGMRQAEKYGTKNFVKQVGSHVIQDGERRRKKDKKGGDVNEWPHDIRVREFPEVPCPK